MLRPPCRACRQSGEGSRDGWYPIHLAGWPAPYTATVRRPSRAAVWDDISCIQEPCQKRTRRPDASPAVPASAAGRTARAEVTAHALRADILPRAASNSGAAAAGAGRDYCDRNVSARACVVVQSAVGPASHWQRRDFTPHSRHTPQPHAATETVNGYYSRWSFARGVSAKMAVSTMCSPKTSLRSTHAAAHTNTRTATRTSSGRDAAEEREVEGSGHSDGIGEGKPLNHAAEPR